jgi:SAM-dependent methyltransferase
VSDGVLDRVVCPRCAAPLDARAAALACARCRQDYPRVGALPVLLPRPAEHVQLWRRQLALLQAHGRDSMRGLEAQADAAGVLPDGRARLLALARAVGEQVDDFATLLSPVLGGPLEGGAPGLPRGVVEYSYTLFRDWGWTGTAPDENAVALAAVRDVLGGAPGRVLVVGAGACRLAYDVHRELGATETAAVDIDPYLLVVAEAVLRGRDVQLTEASLNVMETARAAQAWRLRAPAGPVDDRAFHLFLADGLAPPFAGGTFDTVLTPWFIDRVPPEIAPFLETVKRLLRPGGRWLNHGPLLYPPETPLPRRHTREELFDLAERAGFRVTRWSQASAPHLVSPLTGAGKIERVLTFEALAP